MKNKNKNESENENENEKQHKNKFLNFTMARLGHHRGQCSQTIKLR